MFYCHHLVDLLQAFFVCLHVRDVTKEGRVGKGKGEGGSSLLLSNPSFLSINSPTHFSYYFLANFFVTPADKPLFT
jgi:hypothetical protein